MVVCIDIETRLIDFIERECDAEVFDAPPVDYTADSIENYPDEFITVERLGGGQANIVMDYPTVAIQCWSTSSLKASDLAREVADKLTRFELESGIVSVNVSSLQRHNDPVSKKPRYQLVADIITIQ